MLLNETHQQWNLVFFTPPNGQYKHLSCTVIIVKNGAYVSG